MNMSSLILFLINPLIGFISSLKRLDQRFNGLVFVLFYALFGYAISFNLTSADSYRIAARFCQNSFDYKTIWQLYQDGTVTDVYLLLVYGIVQQFTRNPKVLFGVLGAIMGAISYLSIKQLYTIWREKRDKYFYLIVFFFSLSISFFNVNGIRFWTATAWFSYFVIRFLYFDNKVALLGIVVTPLIHFGFLLGVLGFLLFIVLRLIINNQSLFFIMMLVSFAISIAIPNSRAGDIIGSLGDTDELSSNGAINRKTEAYVHSSEADYSVIEGEGPSLYRQANSLFTEVFDYVNKIGMVLMLSILYKNRKRIIQDKKQWGFFNYVLFSFALGFVACFLIESGGRFIRIANMMYAFWLLTVFQNNVKLNPRWRKYVAVLFVINFYAVAFLLFNSPRLVTPKLWIYPPVLTILDGIGFSPIDFI